MLNLRVKVQQFRLFSVSLKSMKNRVFAILIILCSLYSCVHPPKYPPYPVITFLSVSSSYIQSGNVDTITFSFTDGNGQIAVNNTASDTSCNVCGLQHGDSSCLHLQGFNVFVIDNRTNCISPSPLATPNLVPSGNYKDISGNMEVLIDVNTLKGCIVCNNDTCNPGSPNPLGLDTVVYTIYIKDLAGHLSNAIQTTPIITSCWPAQP
jgi:hypothetical protein